MSDFKFGDHVLYKGIESIVLNPNTTNGLITIAVPYYLQNKDEAIINTVHHYELKRLPRILEEIEVSDDETFNHFRTTRKKFIKYYKGSPYPVTVLSEDIEDEFTLEYKYFRLIPKEITKAEKIVDIVKRIEQNDPVLLREMAEIILSAREKIKGE